MAMLLRTVGVPTRNVTGFLGGRLNRFGVDGDYYTLSQSDAHSWVEVYVEGVGWIPFDPTPPRRGGRAARHSK
jgi:transglutaminase-like putative cysteine protease